MPLPTTTRPTDLLRSGASLAAAALVAGAGNYATNVVVARRLDTTAFGDASVVVTMMLGLTCVAGGLQLAAATTAPVAASTVAMQRRRAWRLGIAVAIGIAGSSPLLSAVLNTRSAWVFLPFAAAVPFQFALGVERGLLQGRMRFGALAVNLLTEAATRFAATAAVVWIHPSANAASWGLLIAFFASHRLARRLENEGPDEGPSATGRPPLAAPMLFTLAVLTVGHVDVLMVKGAFSPDEAGTYALVALIGRAVLFLGAAGAGVVLPLAARGDDDVRRTVRSAAVAVAAVGTTVTVAFGIGGGALLGRLFGETAADLGAVVWYHLAATTIVATVHVVAAADLATGATSGPRLLLAAAATQTLALATLGGTLEQVAAIRLVIAVTLLAALLPSRAQGHDRETGRRRVLLLGTHGQANVGDELLLHTFLDQLGTENRYSINSYDPAATTATIGPRFDADVFDTATTRVGLARRLHSADVVVFAGGSILKELNTATGRNRHSTLLMVLAVVTYARWIARTPVLMANIGVGPLPSPRGRRLAGLVLRQVDVVAVRDHASAALCRRVGLDGERLRTVPDAVYATAPAALPVPDRPAPTSRPLRVAINLNHDVDDEAVWEGFLQRLAAGLRHAATDGPVELVGLPMQSAFKPDHDRAVLEDFLASCGLPFVVEAVEDHHDAAAVLGSVDVVVAERLHAIVLASIMGTPTVALPYSVKVTELVTQLGIDDLAFSVDEAFDPLALARAVRMAAEAGPREGTRLRCVAQSHHDALEPYFAEVRAWIRQPRRSWTARRAAALVR